MGNDESQDSFKPMTRLRYSLLFSQPMKKIFLIFFVMSFTACDSSKERKATMEKEADQMQQKIIDSALGSIKSAIKYEDFENAGLFTMTRQEYQRSHADQIYYITTTSLDVEYRGQQLFLSFTGIWEDCFILGCQRSQIESIIPKPNDDPYVQYLVVFTIDDYSKPQLTVGSEVVDGDSETPNSSYPTIEASSVTLVRGKLLKVVKIPE